MHNYKEKLLIVHKICTRWIMYGILCFLMIYACSFARIDNQHFDHVKKMNEVLDNRDDTPYPNKNFVSLTKKIIDASSENGEVVPLSTASGIIIKREKNTLYGLTAAHWCAPIQGVEFSAFSQFLGYPSAEEANKSIMTTADFFGHEYYIEILDMDQINDVCIFSLESKYANQISRVKIAKKMPDIGDVIYTSSAPLGISGPTVRLHFDGYFGGCLETMTECFYTIPGVSGSSGSGVLNEKGELVSILTISIIGFPHVTGGVRLDAIKKIIDKNT